MLEKFQHAENTFENFKHAVGEKQIRCKENVEKWRKQIWDKYQFTFGEGALFKV